MKASAGLAVAAAIFLTAMACSTQAPGIETSPGPRPGVLPTGSGAEINLARDSYVDEDVVPGSVADVWRVLPVAWGDAQVPVNSANTAQRTLRSGSFKAPSRIVGKSLSDFFDCGYSISGPRVTLWEVTVDVASAVLPDSAGMSRVATMVNASARPRDGSSTGSVACTSRGELERIIVGNVKVRLGG